MREWIAELLEEADSKRQPYIKDAAEIVSLICEEIEKELGGREEDMIADVDYKEGWQDCRHWVLTLLRSEK